jgi:hypothetical protein
MSRSWAARWRSLQSANYRNSGRLHAKTPKREDAKGRQGSRSRIRCSFRPPPSVFRPLPSESLPCSSVAPSEQSKPPNPFNAEVAELTETNPQAGCGQPSSPPARLVAWPRWKAKPSPVAWPLCPPRALCLEKYRVPSPPMPRIAANGPPSSALKQSLVDCCRAMQRDAQSPGRKADVRGRKTEDRGQPEPKIKMQFDLLRPPSSVLCPLNGCSSVVHTASAQARERERLRGKRKRTGNA